MKPDQVSLAIGKGGHNIKLAGKLSGYEIDAWIIEELKSIGCDTAKSVLAVTVDDLVKRTDLEEETIREVVRILRTEFE